jgi:hypothetical protein
MTAAPRALAAALLAVLALLGAGCSGGDGDTGAGGTTATTQTTGGEAAAAADAGTADPEPGKILLSFVRAAGKGNAEGMWKLLSEPTQASIGPTLEDFRADAAINLQAGLGTIASTAKVILSRKLADDWAAAAVAGDRTVKGETEHFAYGAAFLSENGKLKLELGGVVIAGYKPDPTSEIDEKQPTVAASVGAGGDLTDVRMWLDGRAFSARHGANDTPFTATLSGKPAKPLAAGLHTVVVFAATSQTATATAWAFTVE